MDRVASSPESSHSEILLKITSLVRDAKSMPPKQLCSEGDYKGANARYPQTESERIVNELLSLMIERDWVDNDPILSEMTGVLSQLDMGVNKPNEWQALFALAAELEQ